ncbi:peptidylprolyl isomerase [Sporanaerobium hydrogeniformans]|uniref:Peptidylprolyl isomerase n=2 Tax=Sporanaerobium hydrogeniformans TaxID=3072179 RepID=A0AC61DD10_9FIRM|nr:peptidylprolyl isomerase [Sporanaerobium hydrogeniformans]
MESRAKTSPKDWPHPIVTVTLENGEVFRIELYPEEAPNTVNNFITLAQKRFYNDLAISKVIPDYLIQTGDPLGNGRGFPGYLIKSECRQNGVSNSLPIEAGTVCMARSSRFNTEGSQFFILLQKDSRLEGYYTAFGKVIEGLPILEELSNEPASGKGVLQTERRVKTVTIETFGYAYDEPEVLSPVQVREASHF